MKMQAHNLNMVVDAMKSLSIPNASKDFKNMPNFHGLQTEDIDEFIFLIENNFSTNRTNEKDKVSIVANFLRNLALSTYRSIINTEPYISWNDLKKLFLKRFRAENFQSLIRLKLAKLKQTGVFSEYLTKFQAIMNKIEKMDEYDKIHWFVEGLEHKTRMEVGYRSPKTLVQAIEIATQFDRYHSPETENEVNINYTNVRRRDYRNKYVKNNNSNRDSKGRVASKKEIICYKCNRKGHIAADCYTKKENYKTKVNISEVEVKKDETNTTLFVNTVNIRSLPTVKGTINNNTLNLVLDTGANTSVLSERIAKKLNLKNYGAVSVETANGLTTASLTQPLTVVVHGIVSKIKFIILPIPKEDALLGLDWFAQNKAYVDTNTNILHFPSRDIYLVEDNSIINEDIESFLLTQADLSIEEENLEEKTCWNFENQFSVIENLNNTKLNQDQRTQVISFLESNDSIFANSYETLGCATIGAFKINTNENNPIFIPPYRKSKRENEIIDKEIEKMLKAKIIRPSTSPWSSSVVVVEKKDGSPRLCIDYRQLNKITIDDAFPLPRVADVLESMAGFKWFSTLDFRSGYWQIRVSDESIEKTAFSTTSGHYEFLRMPFGPKNAPKELGRIMLRIFGSCSFIKIYYDDMTVYSATFEEHIKHLNIVFEKLKHYNLRLNKEKCSFCQPSIKLLGHIVSGEGIQMDENKIAAVKNMKPPTNVKELQRFLGFIGYYRRFIKDFAKLAAPLYALLQKDKIWNWDADCNIAFSDLIQHMIVSPILRQPDLSLPFILFTDASNVALGAILSQKEKKGYEYVIAYASRLLKGPETKYGITEKECLAVLWGIRYFRSYLDGQRFKVVTDHSALIWLMNVKDPHCRLARWSIYLQSYEFDVVHRKGKKHTNVDILSRPVNYVSITNAEDTDCNEKQLDPYENSGLMYYLKYKKFRTGISKRQIKRIIKLAENYKLIENRLFYKKPKEDTFTLEIPPVDERNKIIEQAHLVGHFQTESTYDRLKTQYFWKNMRKDVEKVVKSCSTCHRNQKVPHKEHSAIALAVTNLFDRIGIDLVLGLPLTKENYNGILVITEYLSKFPYAVPIKSKSAQEIAEKLFEYISIFGPPKVLLSDQGKEFINQCVRNLCSLTGIEHRVTSAYHPRTNGLTERFNQTLVNALRKHCEKEPENWHKWINFVLLAYRSRLHSATNATPFKLMFGREMNNFNSWRNDDLVDEETSLIKRSVEINKLIKQERPEAIETINEHQIQQKQVQNQQHSITDELLKIGTQVYIRAEHIQNKLAPRYHGPYTIDGYTRHKNYWLTNIKGERLKQSYPLSRLKTILESNEIVEVEKILERRKRRGHLEYLVQYKDKPESQNEWLHPSEFNSTELIEVFENNQLKTNQSKSDNVDVVSSSPADL